jgi:DNA-binding MarR family transcriptional regulator
MGPTGSLAARDERIDDITEALPRRASMLSRLFIAQTSVRVSPTEAGVLQALSRGPSRITELAAREEVTQPAITLLVNRFAARGWVCRESEPSDGRVVLVALTERGHEVWKRLRAEYRALVHEEMATLDDDDVEVLARAVDILDGLISGMRRARADASRGRGVEEEV